MMKRKLDDQQLRETVRRRVMKGDVFRLDGPAYEKETLRVHGELAVLSREEIFVRYPNYLYDVRP